MNTQLKKKIGDTFMVIIHGEDEVFTDKDNGIINKLVFYTIGFIHSAVEEARKEIKKEIKGLKRKPNSNYATNAIPYNQTLQDVLDLLSHKNDK